MNAATKRMVTEAIARRLGMNAGMNADEIDAIVGSDPLSAIVTLSMMSQAPSRQRELDAPDRLTRVARIMGACSSCLGEDPMCAECAGQGRPGSREPDREALLQCIGPPLRRLGLGLGTLRRIRPEHSESGGNEQ